MENSSESSEEFFDAVSEGPVETSDEEEEEEENTDDDHGDDEQETLPVIEEQTKPNYEFERFMRSVAPMPTFPQLRDMEAEFSQIRATLSKANRELNDEISIASWGQQLLLQTGDSQLSPMTVTAVDSLSTKGPQNPLAFDDCDYLSSNLRRSQSSHSANSRLGCVLSSGRQWNSANNSRSGTIERRLFLEAINGNLTDRMPPQSVKSSSLNRDFCGINLHAVEFPFDEATATRNKYSSAEMVIDALTNEYNQNLFRNAQTTDVVLFKQKESNKDALSPSPDRQFSDAASTPIRPPRRKKMLQAVGETTDGAMEHPRLCSLTVDANGKDAKEQKSPTPSRSNSEPIPERPKSKERSNSLKKDQHLMEGVNPLSLHMMRITQGESEKADSDAESVASTDSVSLSISSTIGSKMLKSGGLRAAVHKRIRAIWHRANAKQAPSKEESTSSDGDETSEGSREVQVRAAHHHKGPFYFEQLKLVQDLKGHHIGAVWNAKFSDCGRLLATAGQDSVIRIWVLKSAFKHFTDMRSRYCNNQEPLVDPPSRENSFIKSADSKSTQGSQESMGAAEVANENAKSPVIGVDSMEDTWAPFMPNPLCTFKGHASEVLDVCWSKNYFILSSSMDKTVRLWHMTRSECLCKFQHCDFVTSIAFSPIDDRYFASGSLDGKIRLWLITEKKVIAWNELDGKQFVTAVNYVRNGELIAVGTYDGRCIFYTSHKLTYHAQIDLRRYGLKRYKACKITGLDSHNNKLLITCNDSRVRLYDIRDLSLICKYRGFANRSSQIRARFNHDGQFIICGSEDSMVYLWKTRIDFNTLHFPRRHDRSRRWESIKAHNAVVTTALFAPKPDVIFCQIERDRRSFGSADHFMHVEDPWRAGRVSIGSESINEVIVSADFAGVIYVFLNKPKVVAGSSVFLPS